MRYIKMFLLCSLVLPFTVKSDELLTPSEKVVALTLLGEARGEGKMGVYKVACVIRQRMIEKRFPNTAVGVCLEKRQFEMWWKSVKDKDGKTVWKRKSIRENFRHWGRPILPPPEITLYARELARSLASGKEFERHVTNFANHFYALLNSSGLPNPKPFWAIGKKPVNVYKNHAFYKLP